MATTYLPVFNNVSVVFDSLTQAHTFVKQDSGLMTKVILKRTGLFTWNVASLEYPLKEILDMYLKSIVG